MTCWSCLSNSGERRISPGPAIYEGKFWLVEHAYPSSLLGWLVIVLRRHSEALHDLSTEEFSELGEIQGRLMPLLHEVVRSEKEYVACFAELDHFKHVHFHVIPKPVGLAEQLVGSKIFAFLKVSEAEAVPRDEVRSFCLELRARLSSLAAS